MSNLAFFTATHWNELFPFGHAHQSGLLRLGALKLSEWWSREAARFLLHNEQATKTNVLAVIQNGRLNDRWIPSASALNQLAELQIGQALYSGNTLLFEPHVSDDAIEPMNVKGEIEYVCHPTEMFTQLANWLERQHEFIIEAWELEAPALPAHVTILGKAEDICIHPSAVVNASTLNTSAGPIFIGPGVEIQEGCHLRGPLAIGEGTIIKMGTRIYGPSAFGPECRIGGEVSNCVFTGYSNKGHDGFLGNSVVGKWCNLGADTNSSNLKSNYGPVRLWNESKQDFTDSGLQFCGVLMGDHSKCGINTMFNTGTVVGEGCNVFGGGFQPKHIPSFSWGGGDHWTLHEFNAFIRTAERVMARRGAELTPEEIELWRAQHAASAPRLG